MSFFVPFIAAFVSIASSVSPLFAGGGGGGGGPAAPAPPGAVAGPPDPPSPLDSQPSVDKAALDAEQAKLRAQKRKKARAVTPRSILSLEEEQDAVATKTLLGE